MPHVLVDDFFDLSPPFIVIPVVVWAELAFFKPDEIVLERDQWVSDV